MTQKSNKIVKNGISDEHLGPRKSDKIESKSHLMSIKLKLSSLSSLSSSHSIISQSVAVPVRLFDFSYVSQSCSSHLSAEVFVGDILSDFSTEFEQNKRFFFLNE